jgi:hypothetical protein
LKPARRWQSATFLELVADWDPQDVTAFAGYLLRLADRLHHLPAGEHADHH